MNIGATLLLQEPFAKAFGKKRWIQWHCPVWYLQTPVALSRHNMINRLGGVQKYGDNDVSVLASVWYLQTPVALSRHDMINRLGGVQKYGQK